MKNSAQQDGNVLLIVIVVLIIGAIGFVLLQRNKATSELASLPPVDQRVNPEPQGENKIYINAADPGNKVTVDEVELGSEGYAVIYKDVLSGKRQLIGKSALLTKGSHTNVVVALTSAIKDGDVIYTSLQYKDGSLVMDGNSNAIEMQRNVGMVMSHYEGEY